MVATFQDGRSKVGAKVGVQEVGNAAIVIIWEKAERPVVFGAWR